MAADSTERPQVCMSNGKEQDRLETLAAKFPLDDGRGSLLEPLGEPARGGTTGVVIGGPAIMAASLEGTLTGKESQDSPWADIVRTVSS